MALGVRGKRKRTWPGRPEPGPGFAAGLAELKSHINGFTIATGIIPPVVIMFTFSVLQVELLTEAGVATSVIVSWVAVSWTLGGILGIVLSLYYKKPIAGAWSIPGFIFVGGLLGAGNVDLGEVFGAFWMAGALVFVLGVTGAVKFVVRILPPPVMIAMVAGVLIQFPIDMVMIANEQAAMVAAGILGYALFEFGRGPLRRLPGIAGTIIFCVLVAAVTRQLDFSGFEPALGQITWHTPSFSFEAFLTISIPLALMVVGAENMQATGILQAAGRKPPVNSMTITSGIGGMAAAALGAENANIAGPTTAVMNSRDAGPYDGRYVAGAFSGVTYIVLGVFAGTVVALIGALPEALATILLGMVLVRIVVEAIQESLSANRFAIGAFFAFVIALADVSFLEIGAPFWSLVGGALAAVAFELNDYRQLIRSLRRDKDGDDEAEPGTASKDASADDQS